MRHRILLILLIAVTAVRVNAEPQKGFDAKAYNDELQAYVVKEAKLSPSDAQKFFTLYDAMRAEERKIFSKTRNTARRRPTTDEECRKAIMEKDENEILLKKIQQQHHLKMLKELPASTVMTCLFYAEKFDRMKLREMSAKRHAEKKRGHK